MACVVQRRIEGIQRERMEAFAYDPAGSYQISYQTEDGTIWIYYYDQKIEITDHFRDEHRPI